MSKHEEERSSPSKPLRARQASAAHPARRGIPGTRPCRRGSCRRRPTRRQTSSSPSASDGTRGPAQTTTIRLLRNGERVDARKSRPGHWWTCPFGRCGGGTDGGALALGGPGRGLEAGRESAVGELHAGGDVVLEAAAPRRVGRAPVGEAGAEQRIVSREALELLTSKSTAGVGLRTAGRRPRRARLCRRSTAWIG